MITATYHPSIEVHAIAQVIALTLAVLAICLVPVILTAVAPLVYVCACAVAKTLIVASIMAIVPAYIYIQKGKA